ncbi:MAG: hypothetical protein M1586_02565 [Patescibacteria group bacterium]|nr:hypothetical protein [Patescibacteria group bacterium]MCL5262155.1 hypothetical protein [Patescibacteria group bacterium]
MRKYFLLLAVVLSVVLMVGKAEAACRPSGPACGPDKPCAENQHCSPTSLGGSSGVCLPASGPLGSGSDCFCSVGLANECPNDYKCVPDDTGADTGRCYIQSEADTYIRTQEAKIGLAGAEQIGDQCGNIPQKNAEGKPTGKTEFMPCKAPLVCVYEPQSVVGVCQPEGDSSCMLPLLSLNITGTLACVLTNIVGAIIKGFVKLAVYILSGAIALNSTIYGGASLAKAGFDVVLQFVNLFFVFGILGIGFATMLRPVFPNSKILGKIDKNSLPKFLLAFFLVNFTFALAGIFISFSDKITLALSQIVTDSNAWNYFGRIPAATPNSAILGNIEGIFQLIFMPLLTALVGIGIILVMSAIAIMFFIRWGYLTFLVIISPLVIFMRVFPVVSFKKLSFEDWSQQFIQWLVFAPLMMLFIYIVLSLSSIGLDATTETVFGQSLGLGVGRLIIQLVLLAIGLQQANSLSLGGGKAVFGLASRWLERAKNIPIREGKSLGTILGGRIMAAPQYQRAKNILAGSFITRPLAVGSDVLAGKLKEAQKKSIGEYGAAYKDWSKETLIRYLNSANISLMNPQARTALLQQLQDKKITSFKEGDLAKVGLSEERRQPINEKIRQLVLAAQSIKATGAFEKTMPHHASNPAKIVKGLKPSEILDVVPEAFNSRPVVLAITDSQFRKLGDEGTNEQIENIGKTLKAIKTDPEDPQQNQAFENTVRRLKRIPSWSELVAELESPPPSGPGSQPPTPIEPSPTSPTSPASPAMPAGPSRIINPSEVQPNPEAKIITPGAQPNPEAKIITPGAQPNPSAKIYGPASRDYPIDIKPMERYREAATGPARIITAGNQPNPEAKIITPGAQPNPEAKIIKPGEK